MKATTGKKIINPMLHEALLNIWFFSTGLKKDKFHWIASPKTMKVLSANDYSGIVEWYGCKYYVYYKNNTHSIEIERSR